MTSEQTWLASTPLPDLDVRAAVHVSFSRKQKAVPVEKTSQLACPAQVWSFLVTWRGARPGFGQSNLIRGNRLS